MSTIQNIQVGAECPIELQLGDGAVDQHPQVKIYNQNSSLLITIPLSHRALGNYNGTSYNMPNTDYIKVVYVVYSDAGHSVENTTYERAIDVFYKDIHATVEASKWKMQSNRLTQYDVDGVTPLRVFDLFDENGVPTMRNVTERRPV